MTKKSLTERFEEKYIPEPNSGCWIWTAFTDRHGYGKFIVAGQMKLAHRVSWEIENGSIPENQCVLHRCDTPCCVNPSHLFIGTHRDNMRDMANKGRCYDGRGEKNSNAKFTDDDVLSIRADDRSQTIIAKDYGVGQTAIGKIKRGERWAHIK